MGFISHDAIVVTSFDIDRLACARDEAIRVGLACTGIARSPLNGYVSFLVMPDGSKEGWTDSVRGDNARAAWKDWARRNPDQCDWAHVKFGGDDAASAALIDHGGMSE